METQAPSTQTSGSSKPSSTASASGKKTQFKWLLVLFLLFILLVATAYSGYWLWQQQQQIKRVMTDKYEQILAGQSTLESTLGQPLSDFRQEAEQQRQSQLALAQQLKQQQRKLAQLTATDRTDWLLAEAEFLLRLAHQRLLMASEVNNAMSLLKAADDILLRVNELQLVPVRQAIAEELMALHATPEVDVIGIHSQLDSIRKQIAQLKLYQAEFVVDMATKEEVDSSTGWDKAIATIKQYFRIERRSAEVAALPDNRELAILEKNIQLLLNQAQTALLSSRAEVYQASLESAIEQVNTVYDGGDKLTQAVLEALHQLRTVNISPKMPDLSKSQSLLQSYLNRSHYKPSSKQNKSPATDSSALVNPDAETFNAAGGV